MVFCNFCSIEACKQTLKSDEVILNCLFNAVSNEKVNSGSLHLLWSGYFVDHLHQVLQGLTLRSTGTGHESDKTRSNSAMFKSVCAIKPFS